MTLSRSALFRAFCATLFASALSCVDGPTAPRPLALVTATPEALSLRPLDTVTITARVTSLDGVEISGRPLEWVSLDTSVATVNTAGLVTARAYTGPAKRNTAILVTTLGASTDTVPLEVLPRAVARVIASPAEVTLSPRDSTQLTLRLESAEGMELSDRTIAWSVDDTAKLQVTATGRLRARPYAGPLTRSSWVVGFSEGLADSVRVTVQPLAPASLVISADSIALRPSQVRPLTALLRAASGETLVDFPLQWRSTDTTIAFVNEEGIVTAAYYAGASIRTVAIVVSQGTLADTTMVRVDPLIGTTVRIADPTELDVLGGNERQLGAAVFDAAGIELIDRPITWVALDTAFSRVSVSGLVTVLPYGGTATHPLRFVAQFGSAADTVTFSLRPHVAAWITASPEALTLQPLDTASLGALVQSLDLTTLTGRLVTYATLDTAVARVSAGGLVTATAYTGPAVRAGALVLASGAARDTVPVTITPLAVARVIAARDSLTLAVGDSAVLLAGTVSANGTSLTERAFAWVSGDTAVVQVSASGTVRARPYVGPLTRTTSVVVFSEGLADTIIVSVTPQTATSLELSPTTLTLIPGGVDTLATALRTASGELLAEFPLIWTSTDTTVARVNAEGVVTASYYVGAATRNALIIVRSGTLSDTASVAVNPLTVAQVAISPDSGTLRPSATFQLDAAMRDAEGLLLVDRTATWSSLNPSVASVNAAGLVTAAAFGGTSTRTVQIVAASGTAADTVTLTIPPHTVAGVMAMPEALSLFPLDTATLIPTLTALDLTVLTDRVVAWTSLDTTVATVNAAGRVTAAAYTGPTVRSTAILATSGAAVDTVPVTITPLAVARVIATPSAVTIAVGDSTALSAATESANGTVLSAREFVWISGDTAVVQVSSAGLVRARPYAGPLTRVVPVVVFSGGLADTTMVTVTPLVPGSVQVTPASVSMLPGGTTTLGADVRTAGGAPLADIPLTWTSSDTTVVRVNVEGIVTASFYVGATTRNALVIVSTGALADTSAIEVTPLAVASVAITPDSGTVLPSGTFQLDASLRDAAGLLLTGRTTSWSSLDSSVASVNASGLVTAAAYGGTSTRTARIVATSGSAADTITLTLPPLAPAWLTATPEALSLQPRDTVTITALVQSLNLTELTGRTVSFASLDTTIVRVDAAGRATAVAYTGPAVRTSAIVLTSGVAVDTVPVTVTPLAIARVIATPAAVTIAVGDSTALNAVAESTDGTALSSREFAWISSDTAAVQVSGAGVVRARPYAGPLERTVAVVVFAGGVADTTLVTVTPLIAGSVQVTPASVSLIPGGISPLSAAVRTAGGLPLTDFPLMWTSTDTTVARVNADGIVTAAFYVGAATRTTQVIVSTGALADTSSIEVLPLTVGSVAITPDTGSVLPNGTIQLDVSLRDSEGLLLTGRTTTWTSLSPAIATVNSSGLVTAASFGGTATRTAQIVAASGSAADTITLTLPPLAAAWLTATPEALTLQPLDTTTVSALVQSLDLTTLTGRTVSFASLDTTIVRVDANGQATAAAYTGPTVRSSSIVLTSGAATDTVPVTVTPLAIARVISSPAAVTLAVGDSATLSAVAESSNGTVLSAREFVWLSSDTSIVQVSETGIVRTRPYTGPLERSAQIVVFSGGVADTTTVSVTPQTASSVEVTPTTVSLFPGGLDTLTAAVRTAGGLPLTNFPLAWSSTDSTVVRVNAEGIITAQFYVGAATRSAQVIVSTGSLADTTSVDVLPLVVDSVAITPDLGNVLPGGTFQLDASLRDADGLLLVDRVVSWTSLDPAIATVNASGLVSAAAFGGTSTRTVQIVATSAAAADTITLTLPPLDAAWLTATPEALTLAPLDTTTLSARVESLDLTELTGRSVNFASVDPLVATVNAAGRVSAVAYTGPTVRSTAIVLTSGAATDTVPVTVTPLAIARVISSPSTVTLSVGDSTTLTAVTESANGTALTEREFVWLSSDTSIVQVSETGIVRTRPYTGPLDRTVQIVVYSGGVADTTSVTVTPLVASQIAVTPATASLLPGGVTTLSATVRTADNVVLSNFPLTWSTTDTTVARVNVEGIVTAQFYVGAATRSAMIIVATGALADTSLIEVLPLSVDSVAITPDTGTVLPSGTFQLDAALRDAGGLLLVDRTVTWSSLSPAIASVNASGLVTAAAFGGTATRSVQIVATSGGVADTATLTIPPHPVAGVTAAPEALNLFPLDTTTIVPTVTALNLTVLSDRPVTWASLDDAVATVDINGRVTATAYTGPAVRSTAIVLTSAAATDTVPVSVSPFAVSSVIASPSAVTLAPDDTTTLSLSLESAGGIVLSGRNRLWLSADTSIVAVDSLTGLVTVRPYAGAATRNVDVVVYSEGKADTVAVTISPLVASSIRIAPDTVSIFPGEQSTLAATLRSASDTVLVGRPITWTSTDPAIATVNGDGIVAGLFYVGPDERTVNVIAANGVLADTALIRVRALLVDSLTIFPDTQTLQADQTAQLSVVLRDSAGLFLTGRTVTWSSSDSTLATVSDSGLVHALVAGTVTITATSGGVSSQATITIVPVVTSVRVTPELATVWIGRTQPLTVALRDTTGAVPSGRRVRWTSSDSTRATVDSLGVVTALSTGLVTIRAISEGRSDSVRLDVFPEPSAAVTITFDDSWRGVLELAYPILQELRLRANVGWITNVNWAGVMNPTELRVLQDAGWSIVSHSMSHPFMTQISIDSALVELQGSRARIDSLGFDPRVFIAPYLDYNPAVLAASATAGYTYTRCCAEDTWSTDTLVQWPIQAAGRHRLAGVDVTNYDGQVSSYNFRTALGRDRLRQLLLDVVAEGKFLDVFFHDVLPEDVPDLRLTLEILAEFRPYLITYAMLP